MQGIQIGWSKYTTGGFTSGYQYGPDLEAPAIVSTGSQLIEAPLGMGYELQLRLAMNFEHYYEPDTGIMFISCNERSWYQDFSIKIDHYEFTVRKEDYIMSVNDALGD